MRAAMRRCSLLLRSIVTAGASLLLVTAPALAQTPTPVSSSKSKNPLTPPPPPKGGLCAPWHSCVAKGALAAVVLYLLFLGLQFLIQRASFKRLEHQQGHPEGVAAKKE